MSSLIASTFLRRIFAFDAIATVATGGLLAVGAQPLHGLMGLDPAVGMSAGLFLIAYAVVPAIMAARRTLPVAAVWTVIAINAVWVLESLASLALGWVSVNALGTGFVIAQAAAVGVIAELQYLGMRRSERFA
jgi:hypothetical protein